MVEKTARARLLQRWAIPGLLVVVALRQIWLSHTVGLSAWHGGGFGMFASVDRDERRLIQVQAATCQGQMIQVDLRPPSTLLSEAELIHVMTVPKVALLEAVGQKVLAATLQPSDRPNVYLAQAAQTVDYPSETCLQQVTVQVWRPYHRRHLGQIWYEPISPAVEVSQ
ncbi:hypothetical protein [Almyronema epifaneia]|uniref:Uncharacterized protein n=1 Tax=Almyronema epifaneia S1 TaxID=2991925 RepID=A0ABW6IEL3_9CYAN